MIKKETKLGRLFRRCLTGLLALAALSPATALGQSREVYEKQLARFDYNPEQIDPAATVAVLGFNTIASALVCGAVTAGRGGNVGLDSLKCASGGAVQWGGMVLGTLDAPVLPGIGSQVVNLGTDWISNTLEGLQMFDRLHHNFGPVDIIIDTRDGSPDFRWSPISTVGMISGFASGYKFNLEDTVNYQAMVFRMPHGSSEYLGLGGQTYGNVIFHDAKYPGFMAHENIHRYRFNTLASVDPLVNAALPPGLIKDAWNFTNETLRVRVGQEVVNQVLAGVNDTCKAFDTGGPDCTFKAFDVYEWEANAFPNLRGNFSVTVDPTK